MNKKNNILVVDDSETNLVLLEAILEEENFNVQTALSAKEGLELIQLSIPDLILLDILMPNENGFDFLNKLNSSDNYNQIPVIMVTAFANTENKSKANDYGVVDVIEKPIDIPSFLEKVYRALELCKDIIK